MPVTASPVRQPWGLALQGSIGMRGVPEATRKPMWIARQSFRLSVNFTTGMYRPPGRGPANSGYFARHKRVEGPAHEPDNRAMRVIRRIRWAWLLGLMAALAGCSSGLKRPVVTAQAELDAHAKKGMSGTLVVKP